jgi:hypothetical protein
LVEGWAYTLSRADPIAGVGHAHQPFWNPEILALNDSFIESPTERGARALSGLGASWLYVDKTVPYSEGLAAFATPRFETEWAWVLQLDVLSD